MQSLRPKYLLVRLSMPFIFIPVLVRKLLLIQLANFIPAESFPVSIYTKLVIFWENYNFNFN